MKNKETNILIFSNVFREIINIFSGPFLTAYFFKISKNSLIDLSTYNIFVFLCVGFFGLMLGYIIRNKFQIGMFRIGVILNEVYVGTLVQGKSEGIDVTISKRNKIEQEKWIKHFYQIK